MNSLRKVHAAKNYSKEQNFVLLPFGFLYQKGKPMEGLSKRNKTKFCDAKSKFQYPISHHKLTIPSPQAHNAD